MHAEIVGSCRIKIEDFSHFIIKNHLSMHLLLSLHSLSQVKPIHALFSLPSHGSLTLEHRLIRVNHISIYNVFLLCLCNLNARITSLFSSITLIPRVSFAGLESKASKEESKKNKKKNLLQKHCFTEVKQLAKAKKKALPRLS